MKYYLAPLEGITGYIFRNCYEKFFHNIDKYFTPFITPIIMSKTDISFKTRELRDIHPQNNLRLYVVPQILTNDSQGFTAAVNILQDYGYREVNLNLGCPSGTVVSKGKGAGFLAKREELSTFLETIFKLNNIKISIKTRIGRDTPGEFYELIKIYNQYPLEELIIHPRTQKDYYGNNPNLTIFKDALELSTNPVCYNGDIFTAHEHDKLLETFPQVQTIMLGRGILMNPGLIDMIKSNELIDKRTLKAFHDEVLYKYIELFNEERNALFRMKELWNYLIHIFSNNKKYAKEIRKSQNLNDYTKAVEMLFEEENIITQQPI